jgi:hypothetical protein
MNDGMGTSAARLFEAHLTVAHLDTSGCRRWSSEDDDAHHGAGQSHLSLFSYNQFGELAPAGPPITVGVADANGVAILAPRADDQN